MTEVLRHGRLDLPCLASHDAVFSSDCLDEENAVVVSIGYSVLKQGDQKLRDVFERADQMMYERKKELKSMGALTGR